MLLLEVLELFLLELRIMRDTDCDTMALWIIIIAMRDLVFDEFKSMRTEG